MIHIKNHLYAADNFQQQVLQDSNSQQILSAMEQSESSFHYPDINILIFEVQFRKKVIEYAIHLSQSEARFATFYYSKCNREYWDLSNEGGFQLKASVSPSKAILDIFENSSQYAFECATAMMIIMYRAAIDIFGTERFNQVYSHLYLWDWNKHKNFSMISAQLNSLNGIPGDVRYFKNPEVSPKTPQWQGENAIELYKNHFYGHGVGIQTSDGVISELNQNRKSHATRSAYLMKRATRPYYSKLFQNSHEDLPLLDRISLQFGKLEYQL